MFSTTKEYKNTKLEQRSKTGKAKRRLEMSIPTRQKIWAFFEALFSQELTNSSPKVATPAWIKMPLLQHQQSAVSAALHLEQAKCDGIDVGSIAGDIVGGRLFSSYGILGDRVGSGKSLTALALVKAPAPSTNYTEYWNRGSALGDGRDVGLLRTRSQLRTAQGHVLTPYTTSLFIVPHALITQWETYVSRDTNLKAKFIKKKLDAAHEDALKDIETYDALFVSSTMWSTFKQFHPVRRILWKRVFIDEADTISISTDYDEIHGLFYWFITASWMNLVFASGTYLNVTSAYSPFPETPPSVVERVMKLNGSNQYLSIAGCRHINIVRRMCSISNGYAGIAINAVGCQAARLIIHNSEEYIQQSFSTPTVTHTNIICTTPANIRVLDTFISPDLLERLNAGDLEGALESIGMSTQTSTEITSAVTKSLYEELKQAKLTYEYKKTITYSADSAKQKALEACEQKIASIESRITAIQERIEKAEEQTCPICYCEVSNPAVTPCCSQLFCFSCLCQSLKRVSACPLCRSRITDLKEIQVVGEKASGASEENTILDTDTLMMNKRDSFLRFMKKNPKAKVLMFSGYDTTFQGMESTLRENEIRFATVNGSQARINKLLTEFKNGKYNVLFLNARNMGAGLNIEIATHVVLFHRMTAELETQIVGRAMRLGRKDSLDVVHLLHANEVGNTITYE